MFGDAPQHLGRTLAHRHEEPRPELVDLAEDPVGLQLAHYGKVRPNQLDPGLTRDPAAAQHPAAGELRLGPCRQPLGQLLRRHLDPPALRTKRFQRRTQVAVTLPGLASKDLRGASGLTGRVDRHRLSAFGDALMLSVVGAGLALSQRRPDWGGSAYPSPSEVMAGSVAAELSRVATEMLRTRAGRAPTIQIQEGIPFHVFMSGDLALPPYQAQDGFLEEPLQRVGRR